MKKVLSVLLCAVMLLGTFGVLASAADPDVDARSVGQAEAFVFTTTAVAPVADGVVNENEYTASMDVTDYLFAGTGTLEASTITGQRFYFSYDEENVYFAIEVDETAYPLGVATGVYGTTMMSIYLGVANGGEFYDVHRAYQMQVIPKPMDEFEQKATWGNNYFRKIREDGGTDIWVTDNNAGQLLGGMVDPDAGMTTYECSISFERLTELFGVEEFEAITIWTTEQQGDGANARPNHVSCQMPVNAETVAAINATNATNYIGNMPQIANQVPHTAWLGKAPAAGVEYPNVTGDDFRLLGDYGQEYLYAFDLETAPEADGVVGADEYADVQEYDVAKLQYQTAYNGWYSQASSFTADMKAKYELWNNYYSYDGQYLYMAAELKYADNAGMEGHGIEGLADASYADVPFFTFAFSINDKADPKSAFETYRLRTFISSKVDETHKNLQYEHHGKMNPNNDSWLDLDTTEQRLIEVATKMMAAGYNADTGVTTYEIVIDLSMLIEGKTVDPILSVFNEVEQFGTNTGFVSNRVELVYDQAVAVEAACPKATNTKGQAFYPWKVFHTVFLGCVDHEFGAKTVASLSDHKVPGETIALCANCGAKSIEYAELVPHEFETYENVDDVQHKAICDCGEEVLEDHDMGNGVVTTPADHFNVGEKTYTCACGKTATEEIDKDPAHVFGDWEKVDDNTHKKVCSCGEDGSELTADHVWGEGVVTTPATHTKAGVKTFTCADCGATKTEAIAKTTAHAHGDWEKADDNNHKKTCACGDVITEKHDWDDGKVTTEATEEAEGVKTFTCEACGATKTEAIEKIAPADVDATEEKKGCKSAIGGAALVMSLVATLGTAYVSRRKEN